MRNINTASGSVNTENMGITLMHEHVFNLYPYYKEKENTEYVKKQIEKLMAYNVGTIVDLTPYAKIGSYKNFINQCDINIVCAMGFFLDKYVPASYKNASVSDLVEKLSKKVEIGIGENKYKPGIIKIAASSSKLSDRQMRFFEAAVILQKKYKIPIATHSPFGGLEHLKTLLQMGAIPEHIYLSHLENEIDSKNFDFKIDEIKDVINNHANIVITNFGANDRGSRYKSSIRLIEYLKKSEFLSQTLISADSNWRWKGNALKLRDSQFNGAEKTYSYVFDFIIPALKKVRFTDHDINQMLISNPKRIFDF
ncbi:MAG: hypothetical protein PHR79_10180 [Bacteroidales bacterium]|nr:hypothetical protein [Bacteroidales bacterium]